METRRRTNRAEFFSGMKDSIPIALGYFAVAFSLGIVAKNAGLNPFQGFLAGLLNNASAGEYAGFMLIAAGGTYLEMVIVTLITNARYLLMGCAMSQKLDENTPWYHRLIIGFDLTDELFALSIAKENKLNPFYFYGGMVICMPFWASGTVVGIVSGTILPDNVISSLSVALYGMFIAIIMPPARKNPILVPAILISFAGSFAMAKLSIFSQISSGTRIIILTVVISSVFAILFPVKDTPQDDKENVSSITDEPSENESNAVKQELRDCENTKEVE